MSSFKALNFQLGNFAPDDLFIANTGSGAVTTTGVPEIEVIEEWLPRRFEPYTYGIVQNTPLEFEVEFASKTPIDRRQLESYQKIISGNGNRYRELRIIQDDMSSVCYKVICIGADIMTYGGNTHVIKAKFRNKSGYAYENVKSRELGLVFYNNSDYDGLMFPILEFTAESDMVSISNRTTGDEMKFTGLTQGESLIIDCDKQTIVSSTGLNRLGNHNGVWISFAQGKNSMSTTNVEDCVVEYQLIRRTGV